MSAPPDPTWLRAAERAYGACLYLYPRALRQAHGDEMRQAFRDRCREVARSRVGAWRLFGAELAPDLFASAARAHLQAGRTSDARVLPALFVLTLLCTALATQPHWSGAAVDAMKAAERNVKIVQEGRELNYSKDLLRGLSDELVAKGDAESIAVAALLQRVLYDRQELRYGVNGPESDGYHTIHLPNEGSRATALAAQVVATGGSATALSIAAQACAMSAGCNEDLSLQRLLARDPENAFAWTLEFRRAAKRGDTARMQAAIDGTRQARYFESHAGTVHKLLFEQVMIEHAGDGRAIAEAADQFRRTQRMNTDDFTNSLLYQCGLRKVDGPHAARWVDSHPGARADCLHLAGLLAGSTDLDAAWWGWRQLHWAAGPLTGAQVRAMREVAWLAHQRQDRVGLHRGPDGRSWIPWTRDEWVRWNQTWKDDGEIPAFHRWLRAEGLRTSPPAGFDFDLPFA
jgi:hypothetical protein